MSCGLDCYLFVFRADVTGRSNEAARGKKCIDDGALDTMSSRQGLSVRVHLHHSDCGSIRGLFAVGVCVHLSRLLPICTCSAIIVALGFFGYAIGILHLV